MASAEIRTSMDVRRARMERELARVRSLVERHETAAERMRDELVRMVAMTPLREIHGGSLCRNAVKLAMHLHEITRREKKAERLTKELF